MSKTLDEWIEQNAKRLRDNLRANLDAMTDLDKEEKEALMRVNMIMVRDWAQDWDII